jgi:hypothetical protein
MRTSRLIEDSVRGNIGVPLGQETFDGYEQRLIQWGCLNCRFFEKRLFSSGVASEELDAYIICRFAGEPIDLIGEATACPKESRPQLPKTKSRSRWGRRRCVHRA